MKSLNKRVKFEFTISGLVFALILIAAFTTSTGLFISGMQSEFNVSGDNALYKYNHTSIIVNDLEDVRDKTEIKQDEGILDVIGGYFSSGYTALKITTNSVDLFGSILDEASEDVEGFSLFKTFIWAFIIAGIFIGVVITVLVKMNI